MTRRALTVPIGLGVLAAAGVAIAVVLIFGGGTVAPEQPGTDAGYPISPIGTEPADIAAAVISGVFTWQPAVQDSPWDALHSQRSQLTGPMATAAEQPPTVAPKPLPEWAAWARSGDTITAVVRPNGVVTINGDTATVPVTISQTVQHTSGEITPFTVYAATIALEKRSDRWRVADYDLRGSN